MDVHLIGIAGTAMASLATLLQEMGHQVRGSDEGVYPPMSTLLSQAGIDVRIGYSAANLAPVPDLVVVGNAIPRGNPELEACLDAGMRYTSQAEALEDLILPGRAPVVVSGTHGKTTTTSLIAWILCCAGRDPGWFIGGVPRDLATSACTGKGPPFVIEGDEYDTAYFDKRPKFHHYRPRVLVIGNLEYDHADIYPDLASIEREFVRLVNTVPRSGLIVVGADSPAAHRVVAKAHCPVLTFGLDANQSQLSADQIVFDSTGTRFRVVRDGQPLFPVTMSALGHHSVLNALAAAAVALHLGIDHQTIAKAIGSFRGVRRRLDLFGSQAGIDVYDDFAHHPTAIRATLEAVRGRGLDGRLWAVLEPRSWSMRRNIHQAALPEALAQADVVVMTPVHQLDRVPAGLGLDVGRVIADIRSRGAAGHAVADAESAVRLIADQAVAGDVVLVMSNGGFDGIHQRLLDALSSRSQASPSADDPAEP